MTSTLDTTGIPLLQISYQTPTAPVITSIGAATFVAGTPGSFTVTTTGVPSGPKLTISDGGATLPGGVTFTDNGNGTATLAGTPAVGTGGTYPFTITASNGIGTAATQAFTLSVVAHSVTITVTASPSAITFGGKVTITASVVAQGSSLTPTGTVSFSDGPITGCQNVPLVNGVATCTTSSLAVGSDPVTVTYNGDSVFITGSALTTVAVSAAIPVPVPATGAAASLVPALPLGIGLMFFGGCAVSRRRRIL